jgi:serine protease Do
MRKPSVENPMTHFATAVPSLTAVAVSLVLAFPGAAYPQSAQEVVAPPSFSQMVSQKLPAVVGILSTVDGPRAGPDAMPSLPPGLEEFFGLPQPDRMPPGPMRAQGSGFIISADGYVVTNNHVIDGAQEVEVALEDGRQLVAEVVGADPATDIALLKIESDGDLPAVAWGDSDLLEIGDWVVAIGNPFGLGGTVTAGIVSARSRDINAGPYDDFIQTDAAINSGNSGGPLFDTSGQVVGVNTAIFSPSGGSIGIGFAVPSRVASRVVEDLREDGIVERGWLGVQIQPLDEALASALGLEGTSGALIAAVEPGSPAEEAGLVPGTVITAVNGEAVETPRDLAFAVAELARGSETAIEVRSGPDAVENVTVTIGVLPTAQMTASAPGREEAPDGAQLGLGLMPLAPQLREQLDIPETVDGLAVVEVRPGSPSAEAGLRQGDVIVEAAGQPVTDPAVLQSAAAEARTEGRPLLLRLFRNGSYSFRAVQPAGS